jgi:hypothetical protein
MMNGYGLTAAIFQSLASLAWPAAIFGSVFLFREKLTKMLPNFRAKYKDIEVDFRLTQAEKEAAALPNEAQGIQNQATPEEKSRFLQIASLSPRAAILEVRLEIEEALRIASSDLLTGTTLHQKPASMLALTRMLRNADRIDAHLSSLLDDLRAVGNEAAHSTGAQFSTDDALRYRSLADQALPLLTHAHLRTAPLDQ